jgi:hypothetical protein
VRGGAPARTRVGCSGLVAAVETTTNRSLESASIIRGKFSSSPLLWRPTTLHALHTQHTTQSHQPPPADCCHTRSGSSESGRRRQARARKSQRPSQTQKS